MDLDDDDTNHFYLRLLVGECIMKKEGVVSNVAGALVRGGSS